MDEYEDDDLEDDEDDGFDPETGYFDFSTFRQEDDYETVTISRRKRISEFLLWLVKHIPLLILLILIPLVIFMISFRDEPPPASTALFSLYILCLLGIYFRSFYKALRKLKSETREILTAVGAKRFQKIGNYDLYYALSEQRHQRAIQILFVSTCLYFFTVYLLLPQSPDRPPVEVFLALLPTFPYA